MTTSYNPGQNTKFIFYVGLFTVGLSTSASFLLQISNVRESNDVGVYGTSIVPVTNFSGTVTKVIDGDTVDISINGETERIRLVLVDAPEYLRAGYFEMKAFVIEECLDKDAEVDPDNNQDLSYGRIIGVLYCDGTNMNAAVLDNGFATLYQSFCSVSEFGSDDWA